MWDLCCFFLFWDMRVCIPLLHRPIKKTTNTWEGEKNSQMYFVSYLFGFQGNVAPLLQGPLIFPKMYFWLGHSYNKTLLNAYVIDFVHNVYSKEALTWHGCTGFQKWLQRFKLTNIKTLYAFSIFWLLFYLTRLDLAPLVVHKAWQFCWVLFITW